MADASTDDAISSMAAPHSASSVRRRTRGSMADTYLTFQLGDESYAMPIRMVKEIIRMTGITRVPHVPNFIRGVLNLRGKVIPVIELRIKFGMEAIPDNKRTCIVVVHIETGDEQRTIGLIVDGVNEVQSILAEQIEAPPSMGSAVETDFLTGIGKVDERVIMMLDLDAVFTDEHFEAGALNQSS